MPPQKKRVSVHTWVVLRYTDYGGHLSKLYGNQYIPLDILTRLKSQGLSLWSKKDGLFVVLLWTSMSLRQLFTVCGIAAMRQLFTRRVEQGRGRMTTPQGDWYLTICALRHHSATARELQQDCRRVTRVTVSDRKVRNRLREMSLWPRHPVWVPHLMQEHRAVRLLFAVATSTGNFANGDMCCSQMSPDFPWLSMMDVNMVSSTCQMLSRKTTDLDKVLWWCGGHQYWWPYGSCRPW